MEYQTEGSMSLFVVRHEHTADRCPAKDRTMAPMLLTHLSQDNARRFGINIKSEAVIDGAHTLYLTLEAKDEESVQQFMRPFAQAGSLEVLSASPCEVVVGRGAC